MRGAERFRSLGRGLARRVGGLPGGTQGAAVLGLALGAVVLYAWGAATGAPGPRSGLGTGFGVAAVALLAAVMAYSARRAVPAVRALGRTSRYLEVHLQGGALFLLLVLLHTGFRVPHGVLTWWLWAVSLWVVATGFLGLALQRSLPRILASRLSIEVHRARIPEIVQEARTRAARLAGAAGPSVRAFYGRELATVMAAPRARLGPALGLGTAGPAHDREFDRLRATLSGEARQAFDELRALYEAKLEMDVHHTLQRVLRGWLWLHVPAAVLLLGLVALHVFFVLYY